MEVELANGPVSWGVDFPDAPENPPYDAVLDGVAAAGYRWVELGPYGFLPDDPHRLRAQLASRSLQVTASFVFAPLARDHDSLRAAAERVSDWIAAAGGRFIVIIDAVNEDRGRTAGRSDAAPRLGDAAWARLRDGVRMSVEIARERGLRPVIHPHAGTYVEFADEIDRLLADAPALELCLDTGHAAYAGIDPDDLYRRYAARVPYLHLKDVDPDVLERVATEGLGFWEAIASGVFCPLGTGVVDFAALRESLAANGFEGWAMVEQDTDASQPGDPVADAIASREFLQQMGIATADPRIESRSAQ